MKPVWIALLLLAACGDDELAKRKAAMDKAAAADKAATRPDPPPAPVATTLPPTSATKPAAPTEPEPTTPAEIDHARNQAMIDGRDKDVLKYCDLGKLDDKSNPQAILGCTLAACRLKDADTARRYGKSLQKAYRDAANRVCVPNQISI